MIKVNNREIEFQEGMTVAQALKSAGEVIDQMVIVVIDGKVISNVDLNTTIIDDNIEISLFRLVSGG